MAASPFGQRLSLNGFTINLKTGALLDRKIQPDLCKYKVDYKIVSWNALAIIWYSIFREGLMSDRVQLSTKLVMKLQQCIGAASFVPKDPTHCYNTFH